MKLYHGSPEKFSEIRRSQAEVADGVSVPEGELKNAIYLTPSFEYALAQGIATAVRGLTYIGPTEKVINFEDPSRFNQNQPIYIYEVDAEKIPSEKMHQIDEWQIAVDEDGIIPDGNDEVAAETLLRDYGYRIVDRNEVLAEIEKEQGKNIKTEIEALGNEMNIK